MANETTTTSLTELVQSEWISPILQGFAAQYMNPSQWFREYEITNGSSVVSVPRFISDQGNPDDAGDAVDTEFNATEATDISATELETEQSNFSVSEYGIRRDVTDTAIEDAMSADALLGYIGSDAASNLMAAANDDACALFASLSNSSGATTVDLSIANFDDALYDLAERGISGSLVAVLDHQQVRDLLGALQAASTSMAVYAGSVDRQLATTFSSDQGRNVEGFVGSLKGVDIYRQGLTDTANTGEDVVGAMFLRGDVPANAALATYGQANRREFRVETERDASKRVTEVISTMRWGCGETIDASGQKLLSDAP